MSTCRGSRINKNGSASPSDIVLSAAVPVPMPAKGSATTSRVPHTPRITLEITDDRCSEIVVDDLSVAMEQLKTRLVTEREHARKLDRGQGQNSKQTFTNALENDGLATLQKQVMTLMLNDGVEKLRSAWTALTTSEMPIDAGVIPLAPRDYDRAKAQDAITAAVREFEQLVCIDAAHHHYFPVHFSVDAWTGHGPLATSLSEFEHAHVYHLQRQYAILQETLEAFRSCVRWAIDDGARELDTKSAPEFSTWRTEQVALGHAEHREVGDKLLELNEMWEKFKQEFIAHHAPYAASDPVSNPEHHSTRSADVSNFLALMQRTRQKIEVSENAGGALRQGQSTWERVGTQFYGRFEKLRSERVAASVDGRLVVEALAKAEELFLPIISNYTQVVAECRDQLLEREVAALSTASEQCHRIADPLQAKCQALESTTPHATTHFLKNFLARRRYDYQRDAVISYCTSVRHLTHSS
jgi:hypothetical protein